VRIAILKDLLWILALSIRIEHKLIGIKKEKSSAHFCISL
jgi:hypothetical protein